MQFRKYNMQYTHSYYAIFSLTKQIVTLFEDAMGYRKYVNDYRLEVLERPGKKPKTISVYDGPYFDYFEDQSVISGLRKLMPAAAFSAAACFALSLFLNCSLNE